MFLKGGEKMLSRIYKFKWVRRKVKWNGDGKLKCSRCGHIFEEGETVYAQYSRWLGMYGDEVLCKDCYKKMKGGDLND